MRFSQTFRFSIFDCTRSALRSAVNNKFNLTLNEFRVLTAANGKAPTDGVPCHTFNQNEAAHGVGRNGESCNVCANRALWTRYDSHDAAVSNIRPFSLCLCLDLNTSRPIYIFRSFILFWFILCFPHEFVHTIRSLTNHRQQRKQQYNL